MIISLETEGTVGASTAFAAEAAESAGHFFSQAVK